MVELALKIQNVSHSYGDRQALHGLNIELEVGKTLGLLGPNGGGKTTCFRLLSTLMPIQEGKISILGLNVAEAEKEVRRQIGVVFQSPSLDDKLTVFENLKHQGHLYGLLGSSLKQKIKFLLGRLGVGDRAKDLVADLSGGLKRRVEIAKGLLHDPKLLLLDEPSTGLDPVARLEMWKCLEALQKEAGVTIVVTTHLMEEAEGLDKIVILDKGKLIAEGTPQELKGSIGKKVLVIEGASSGVESELRALGNVRISKVDELLHVETGDAQSLMNDLLKEHSDKINSLIIRQPSLEDVFVHLTGHSFHGEVGE